MPGPKQPASAKPKNLKTAFVALAESLRKWWLWIIVALILAVISSVLDVFGPKILGDITTSATTSIQATGSVDWSIITPSVHLLLVLYCGVSILNYAQRILLATVTAHYTKKLRNQILDKITRLPISYFDKHQFGDILSRMSNDIDVLASSLSEELASIIASLTTLIGVTVMMLTISWGLSLITFITVPLSVFCVGKIATKAQKYFREQQNALGELNNHIEEDYSGQLIIKSNNYEPTAIAKFETANQNLYDVSWKGQFFSSVSFPVTHVFTNLSYVAVCIIGGLDAIAGKITIGGIQAFLQYVNRFNRPITEVAQTTSTVQLMLAAAERISDFLDEPEETPDPINAQSIESIKGAIEFHNVCFSYDGKKPVIENFSARIEPGMEVAIVGPTGAGKTTLINLLMRFYDPDSGYITIDGIPTKEMKRSDVRKLFGMVLQDTWLFSGKIIDNLKYGKKHATMTDVKAATNAASIDHFIEALPNGYNTLISEDSDNISAGEKQLFTIARAIVANPPMIILDEATSNVDTRTEQLIQDAFDKLTKNRTSFVIAHRLSTIRNADLILVMKNGNIVEQGNHAELMAKNGFYAELYNSQFAEN